MNKQFAWKFGIVIAVLVASIYSMWPPYNRDFLSTFESTAVSQDEGFTKLMEKFRDKESKVPGRTYGNLLDAAVEQALMTDPEFDLGVALRRCIALGVLAEMTPP